MRLESENCVLVVVDMQPTFLAGIFDAEKVLARTKFIVESANLLDVPVLATVQYPERMGGTEESLDAMIAGPTLGKMAFSCCGCEDFSHEFKQLDRGQVLLVGIETHICITQTALDLLDQGFEVFVAADAVSSRTLEANKIGFKRLRDFGCWLVHSESAVYEWMQGADHEKFRDVLGIVKKYA
ncbi:isochorismatase family protein [Kamptonema cortianum]|nr:isochorismatase family protein [Geitlerinema splendidum]MDK3158563.1 isochorismatase family protein [Kamptonema cortianum]